MLNSVLFVVCIAITLTVFIVLARTIKLVEHIPAVSAVIRSDMNCYATIASLMFLLWVTSKFIEGVLPGFGLVLFATFVLISVAVAVHTSRYARQHLPARI